MSKNWATRKAKKSSGGILEYEGNLIESIAYQVTGNGVEVGSPLVYAAIHQHGGKAVGRPHPERPYLGLSSENASDLEAVVTAFLEGA